MIRAEYQKPEGLLQLLRKLTSEHKLDQAYHRLTQCLANTGILKQLFGHGPSNYQILHLYFEPEISSDKPTMYWTNSTQESEAVLRAHGYTTELDGKAIILLSLHGEWNYLMSFDLTGYVSSCCEQESYYLSDIEISPVKSQYAVSSGCYGMKPPSMNTDKKIQIVDKTISMIEKITRDVRGLID